MEVADNRDKGGKRSGSGHKKRGVTKIYELFCSSLFRLNFQLQYHLSTLTLFLLTCIKVPLSKFAVKFQVVRQKIFRLKVTFR